MSRLRTPGLLLTLAFHVACISLSYPEPEPEPGASAVADASTATRSSALRASSAESAAGRALSWSDLTKAAREHARLGEFDRAEERLEQAEIQVRDLPPTSARRRTVFNAQARLAEERADHGEIEAADSLANRILEEAEREPALGDAALVSLALSVAKRREAAALEAGEATSQLPLYRLAFEVSGREPTSRERVVIGRQVATAALREGDLPLARAAIDRSIADARRLIATPRAQIAQLEVIRARIAIQQGELDAAEDSATAAHRILTDRGADASQLEVSESLLTEIARLRGDRATQSADAPDASSPSPTGEAERPDSVSE